MKFNFKSTILIFLALMSFQDIAFACDDSGAISARLLSGAANGDLTFQVIILNGEDSGDESGPTITLSGPCEFVSFTPNTLSGNKGFPAAGTLSGGNTIITFDNGGSGDWASDAYATVFEVVVRANDYDGDFTFELSGVNLDCDDDLVYSFDYPNPFECPNPESPCTAVFTPQDASSLAPDGCD